ncbi:MAG: C2 family cysteine protease [Endozoicomonas sp.]
MKSVSSAFFKNTALLLSIIFFKCSSADIILTASDTEVQGLFSSSTHADSSHTNPNQIFPSQVIGTGAEFRSVVEVADDDGDERLSGSELIKAYYRPGVRTALLPLIALMRMNFDLLMDSRDQHISLDSFKSGFFNDFKGFNISDIHKEDALWAYAHEEGSAEKQVMNHLFENGLESVRPDNVFQGNIGDCQLISAIASLTGTPYGKRVILSYFESLDESQVKVTFPGAEEPVVIALNEVNYTNYAQSTNGVWLSVLEKAVAEYIIEHDHDPETCSYNRTTDSERQALTEEYQQYKVLPEINSSYVFFLLLGDELESFQPYFVGYQEAHMLFSSLLLQKTILTVGIFYSELYPELPRTHYYSVLAYDKSARRITLRDPHGSYEIVKQGTEEAADGVKDGVFTLSLEEFIALSGSVLFPKSLHRQE